jgi:hypothetical protein
MTLPSLALEASEATPFALPQVAESKIPQQMDVAGEFCLYDEYIREKN